MEELKDISPLILESFFTYQSSFNMELPEKASFDKKKALEIHPEFEFSTNEQPENRWRSKCDLKITIKYAEEKDNNLLATFTVNAIALYSSRADKINHKEATKAICMAFPLHVFPLIRQKIYNLSLDTPLGPIIMPLLDLRAYIKKKIEKTENTPKN